MYKVSYLVYFSNHEKRGVVEYFSDREAATARCKFLAETLQEWYRMKGCITYILRMKDMR